jgi:C-terminal processing protease CtpA/Prc
MIDKIIQIETSVRHEVINALRDQLCKDYVFPEKADEIIEFIEKRMIDGNYDSCISGEAFSAALTEELYNISKDKHLRVVFSEKENSVDNEKSMKEIQEERNRKAKACNYGFYKVERLEGNVGYIDFRNFYDSAIAGETAINAMNLVANTDVIIFDLRKNGGGSPDMIALISSYLFEEPTHLNSFYYRPLELTRQSWTQRYVPGKRSVEKPIYVLTSNYTFSAAEEFTYNLKNLKRATIVGEVTRGGAHPGNYRQITKNFRVFIPIGRAINPITNTNWEGKGVEPDIEIDKGKAFRFAYKDALQYVKNKYQNQEEYLFLVEEVNQTLSDLESEV